MPRFVPETRDKEEKTEAPKIDSITDDEFITLLPLWPRGDASDTEVRGIYRELDPGGGNLVTEPGSYTVTGHAGDEVVEVGTPVCGVDEVGYPGI